MTDELRIRLLGTIEIEKNRKRLAKWPSKAAEAVVIYAVMAGKPVLRSQLVNMIWPESEPKQASANLRAILNSVRKNLGDSIQIERQTIHIPDHVTLWCDALELSETDVNQLTIAKAESMATWLKGVFLPGFHLRGGYPYEEWATLTRERLRFKSVQIVSMLARHHLAEGNFTVGLPYATRWLAQDEFSEQALQTLMWFHLRSGRRSEALQNYAVFTEKLESEIGVEPTEATLAVWQRVQRSVRFGKHRLPRARNVFVGRSAEIQTLTQQLTHPDKRLVTLHGPGGQGKTRLAKAVGRHLAASHSGRFLDGITFVEFASVDQAALVAPTLAAALDLKLDANTPPENQLITFLRDQEMLLILDNLEHLVEESAEFFASLLENCPHITLLTTSRERLHLYEEHVFELSGLDLPSEDGILSSSAAQLFINTAQRHNSQFRVDGDQLTALGQLCQKVSGVPLAIELAAGLVRDRSISDIASSISESFDVLATRFRNTPDRHRSVRAAFETSWQRLDGDVQHQFASLSVFSGSFSAQAAQTVAAVSRPILQKLVDNALLIFDADTGRYQQHELLREYAREQIEEQAALTQTHTEFFTLCVLEWFDLLRSDRQPEVIGWFSADFANIEQMWRYHILHDNTARIDQLTLPLFTYLFDTAQFFTGRALFEPAIASGSTWAQAASARFHVELGRQDVARQLISPCVERMRSASDEAGLGFVFEQFAVVALETGDLDAAGEFTQEAAAIFDRLENLISKGRAEIIIGRIHHRHTNFTSMIQAYEKALNLLKPTGYTRALSGIYHGLGVAHYFTSSHDVALANLLRSVELSKQLGAEDAIAKSNDVIAQIYMNSERVDEAEQCLQQSLDIAQRLGMRTNQGITLNNFGLLEQVRNNPTVALDYYQQAYTVLLAQSHQRGAAVAAANVAEVAIGLERDKLADRFLEEALRLNELTQSALGLSALHDIITRRAIGKGDQSTARVHISECMRIAHENDYQWRVESSFANLGFFLYQFGDAEKGWAILYYMAERSDATAAAKDTYAEMLKLCEIDTELKRRAKKWAEDHLSAETLHNIFNQTFQ